MVVYIIHYYLIFQSRGTFHYIYIYTNTYIYIYTHIYIYPLPTPYGSIYKPLLSDIPKQRDIPLLAIVAGWTTIRGVVVVLIETYIFIYIYVNIYTYIYIGNSGRLDNNQGGSSSIN
jgi:hypothetical protein